MVSDASNIRVRNIILLLVIFNLLDGIFTFVGLSLGVIEEANPLLVNFPPHVILLIKIVLSFFLSVLLLFGFPQSKISLWTVIFIIITALYLSVILLHIYWIFTYFS